MQERWFRCTSHHMSDEYSMSNHMREETYESLLIVPRLYLFVYLFNYCCCCYQIGQCRAWAILPGRVVPGRMSGTQPVLDPLTHGPGPPGPIATSSRGFISLRARREEGERRGMRKGRERRRKRGMISFRIMRWCIKKNF